MRKQSIGLLLMLSGTAQAATFNVRSYGALGDGLHNDGAAIQAAVTAAVQAGSGNTVFFPSGQYVLDPSTSTTNSQINILQGRQLSLLGQPGTMLLNPVPNRPFYYVWASNQVNVTGIDLQYTQRLFSQMTVLSINTQDNSMIVHIDPGYDDLNANVWMQHANQLLVFSDPTSGTWGDHGVDTTYYDPGVLSVCWPPVVSNRQQVGDHTWKLTLNTAPQANYVGRTAVLWDQNNADKSMAMILNVDTDFSMSNVNYYPAGSDGPFYAVYNNGTLSFSNVAMRVLPGSQDRVIAYGGVYAFNNRGTISLNGVSFVGTWDDPFNMGTWYNRILDTQSSTVLDVERANEAFSPGDTVGIWDWTTTATTQEQYQRQTAKIVAVDCGSDVASNACRLTLDQPVTVLHAGSGVSGNNEDGIDRIVDLNAAGSLVVNRSQFQSFHTIGLTTKAQNSLIENSLFYNLVGGGITANSDFQDVEGAPVASLKVINNTFQNVSGANIIVGSERLGNPTGTQYIDSHNIDIEGNRFLRYGRYNVGTRGDNRYPINLNYVDTAIVAHNTWIPYGGPSKNLGSTTSFNSANIVVKDYKP